MDEVLIDAGEVARRLALKKRDTVLDMARAGKFPSVRLSAHVVRFRWSDVCRALGLTPSGEEK